MKKVTTALQLLFLLLLFACPAVTKAQTIDSFHVDRSLSPHRLFVRLQFPDSTYEVSRTFDRVALIYPPVNVVTFFYRSCAYVRHNPVRDTLIPIFTPEPYGLKLWLVRDSNTVLPGCEMAGEIKTMDSAAYDEALHTGLYDTPYPTNTPGIFPNPASGILHITGATGTELQVSDALGRLQLQRKIQNEAEVVDIGALVPGLYYIGCYKDGRCIRRSCLNKVP